MQNNCAGSGPHSEGTVKVMRCGGSSNLILCSRCWQHELEYRQIRNLFRGDFAQFQLPAWEDAEVYAAEARND